MAHGRSTGAEWDRASLRWVVPAVAACALALHLLWLWLLAGTGGDLAAQDAWTGFVARHPDSAYDFAWYGGMHPASYSIISPYVMSILGVRTTMVVAGTATAALVPVLLAQLRSAVSPLPASLYAVVAISANAVSGRVTFGLGLLFAVAALVVAFARPGPQASPRGARRAHAVLTGALAGLATLASPVAGLFLGLVAVATWRRDRRLVVVTLGAVPLLVVLATSMAFPPAGVQPFAWRAAVVPLGVAAASWLLAPPEWRILRACSVVYATALLVVWAVPSPIGTNVTRLSQLFGGVALMAVASGSWWNSTLARRCGRTAARVALVASIATATVWQAFIAIGDVAAASSGAALDGEVRALVSQLEARGADLGRVEVVPSRSHREASALAPYVNLARGWNRQADVARNPLFYDLGRPLTARRYHRWLRHMAVRFVVLPVSAVDDAGLREAALVRAGVPFLHEVWSDSAWKVFTVADPAPVVGAPGELVSWSSSQITVHMPSAGSATVRVAWSSWLSIVDGDGGRIAPSALHGSCLAPAPTTSQPTITWVTLEATRPGTYRISAPYTVPHGTPCSDA